MPLFQIEHPEHPAHVVAESHGHAVAKWERAVIEQFGDAPDIADCVRHVCGDDELIVNDEFKSES